MKNIFTAVMILISSLTQAQVTVDWFNVPGGVSVATDASNNVYTATWDYNPAGDITLTKRNVAGTILWNVSFDNTDNTRHEVATWVETDNAGNVIVSGTIRSGYSNPVNAASLLMKFNAAGTLLWRVVYESSFDGSSTKKCIVDANDNIYVLGRGTGPNGLVTKVKKFNSSGTALWSYLDNTGIGSPVNFKFTPDNNIVISSRSLTGSINGYAKIDLNGNNIWSLAGTNSLTVGDAAGDAFGNTYLINGEYVSNAGSIITKLSPTGAVIWSQTNTMSGSRVEVGTDNNPVISGFPNSGTPGAAFMKYDNNGNVLWQNLDADGPSIALLSHAQLKLDALNAAYLSAGTMSLMAVCKVNSNGTSAWTTTPASGYAYGVDFGTDNSVFVVGGIYTVRLVQPAPITPPAAPSNLSATAGGSSIINVNWIDNANNETNFVLQRSLTSGSGFSTIATLPANTTSYTNTGLNGSTAYYYRVQAENTGGSSVWSDIASATTFIVLAIPNMPSGLRAVSTVCNSILVSWVDNSDNETNFTVSRSGSLNDTFTTIAILPANTISYNDTRLTNGQKYYYRIRAEYLAENSNWSNIVNAKAACSSLLFPNPSTTGVFNLNLPSETTFPVTLTIFSVTGQVVLKKILFNYNNTISTGNLTYGTYSLFINSNGEVKKLKLQIAQ